MDDQLRTLAMASALGAGPALVLGPWLARGPLRGVAAAAAASLALAAVAALRRGEPLWSGALTVAVTGALGAAVGIARETSGSNAALRGLGLGRVARWRIELTDARRELVGGVALGAGLATFAMPAAPAVLAGGAALAIAGALGIAGWGTERC
ncbi:MAG: hypothetical protein IPM29_16505 [Planctomycetes bacterium]|nr:hypothetical protein [Planctomycetota bacterium]